MTNTYVGTKIVTAWPQSKTSADGVSVVEQEGYAVKYEDGYISWSPEATFDAAYLVLPNTSGLTQEQIRVVAEFVQNKDRYEKLRAFFGTDDYANLDLYEKERLARQYGLMVELGDVLSERIEAFRGPELGGEGGDEVEADVTSPDPAAENEDRPLAEVLQTAADKIEHGPELQALFDAANERHRKQFPAMVKNLIDIAKWLDGGGKGPLPAYGAEGSLIDEVHAAEYSRIVEERYPGTLMKVASLKAAAGLREPASIQRQIERLGIDEDDRVALFITVDPEDPDPVATIGAYIDEIRRTPRFNKTTVDLTAEGLKIETQS